MLKKWTRKNRWDLFWLQFLFLLLPILNFDPHARKINVWRKVPIGENFSFEQENHRGKLTKWEINLVLSPRTQWTLPIFNRTSMTLGQSKEITSSATESLPLRSADAVVLPSSAMPMCLNAISDVQVSVTTRNRNCSCLK